MHKVVTSGNWPSPAEQTRQARLRLIEVAKRVSGAHIGGSFSVLDFLIVYYRLIYPQANEQRIAFYQGKYPEIPTLVFSKGHCYLAQLVALDTICGREEYCDSYLEEKTQFFGHPKRLQNNAHFPVSSGALGQGITFANGLAFADKLSGSKQLTISLIGDGEMNEGACTEAILFAKQHHLNHCIVVDNNSQISLGKTPEIYHLGNLEKRFQSFGLEGFSIDGHDYSQINLQISNLFQFGGPRFLILNTIKGRGVSFMEGVTKWHHRRFKGTEFEDACKELNLEN